MHYPGSRIIGLETYGDIIARFTQIHNVAINRVHIIVDQTTCTPYDRKVVLWICQKTKKK